MKVPKYVHHYVDRNGHARFYLRRKGHPRIPLPGLPWSPQFMAVYEVAMSGEPPKTVIGTNRIQKGTVAGLVHTYLNSVTFNELADETKRTRKNVLNNFSKEHGSKPIALLRREHIVAMFAKKVTKRFAARNWLKTVRALMQFALSDNLLKVDPTAGVRNLSSKTDGYRQWNDEDIAAFEKHWPIGTRERLAMALLLWTLQRRSDVVRMGRQHVRQTPNGVVIDVKQSKTGAKLAIPVLPELQAVLADTPADNMTFLTTSRGKPFAVASFTNWFREACNAAGIAKGTSAHGLRKAGCRRFAELGFTVHEIAAWSGHADLREVARYTKAADQERLAWAGAAKLAKKRTLSGYPSKPSSQTEKIT
jgi:integrase